ncbi:unnamed protein product [Calypogeia fissa]
MGKHKTKTTGKGRLDKFYFLAKEQGFRSRAAFKLVQLDRKFRFLEKAHSVLDLCAAPGGWMQVAAKHMPVGSLIIGVDLVPIRPIRGAFTLQEDITTAKCKAAIKKLMKEQGHNVLQVVLHDGSPNVGGAWTSEATSQAALVLDSLKLAVEFLAPGGTFVSKVFRSQDYTALLYAFKQLFEKVEVTKPVASRATSAEIYVIGLKYRAPGKIDPRLLDSRHLFQEVVEAPKVVDVLRGSKQKRHRDGYEDGKTILFKECTASSFVWAEKPLDLLGAITSITFVDESSQSIKDHPLTTKEVKTLCEDLRVLGKQEFKQILKWRLKVREDLKPSEEKDDVTKPEGKVDAPKLDEEETLLTEMGELREAMESKMRKAKKLASKRKAKAKARTTTGMQVDVMEDQYGDEDLFGLAAIKAKKDLARIEDAPSSEEDVEDYVSDDDILNQSRSAKSGMEDDSDYDSEEERQRYDAELDEYLEEAYDVYRKSTDGSTARRKRAKLANADKNGELWEEGDIPLSILKRGVAKPSADEKNPLLVDFMDEMKPSKEQVVEKWFSQDIFADFNARLEDKQLEEITKRKDKKAETLKSNGTTKSSDLDDKQPSTAVTDDDVGFEVVPEEASGSDDSSSSDDESDMNDNAKAETLAYAKKMLRKKSRESILDDAYNRYTFDDDNLPRWFAEDEKKHSQLMKPVTKDDIEAMKAQFRAINARPVRKVAEAKARKKRRAVKKLEQVRQKANAIADQDDLSSKAKGRQMERLYAKASAAPKKVKREIVVAKKGGVGAKGGKGRVVVDRRMKKDLRQRGAGKVGRGGKPLKKKGNMAKGPSKKGSKGKRTQ